MASLEHLDLLLGEALECIVEAAQEVNEVNLPDKKKVSLHFGKAVGELWAVREKLYDIKPELKRDFVKEHEQDNARWEELNDIFMKACIEEDKGDVKSAKQLYEKLLVTSRFGYFRLLAEAGLYRLAKMQESRTK